jgi:hypothetical protein
MIWETSPNWLAGADTRAALKKWLTKASRHMAQPDTPNFSIAGRIIFGAIAIVVIASLLRFFGYL